MVIFSLTIIRFSLTYLKQKIKVKQIVYCIFANLATKIDKDNDKDKYIQRTPLKSNPRDLRPLIHLIRVMRRHDLTKKRDNDNDKYKDKHI